MIDVEMIAKELEFDIEDLIMLIDMFLDSCESSLTAIEEALNINDFETITKEAHSIKGSAANLKLERVSKFAYMMEAASKNKLELDYELVISKIKEQTKDIKNKRVEYA